MLDLAKIKPPSQGGHKPKMSLNLSAISATQSVNDTSNGNIGNPSIVNPNFYKE